ncbi:MAG: UDP-N-acetylglucosamine 2-epimerase (non-hydrolyzing) [bacterium]|nr:UDP-N-acetylglucosamine 2-epimerase (non-hydrolyzing) [bacterium]
MKVMTILGTRPEIIRLSLIIKKLDKAVKHVLVHTGQNYEKKLNGIFFKDLDLRAPDHYLGARADSFGSQAAIIIQKIEKLFLDLKPDRVLVLGDTNSGLSSIVAERMMIPVYHMEAGNRCYDLKVPEEKNRRIIDSISSFALPYTPGSRENLIREGLPKQRIFISGNPIFEVLTHYQDRIDASSILDRMGLEEKKYFLVTAHRSENVDTRPMLQKILRGLELVLKKYGLPVVVSVHPRTRHKLEKFKLAPKNKKMVLSGPFGFFDFVKLEKNALCVLTDSGTVQEECCIFHVPAVTMRDTTERPETVECGSNIVSGLEPDNIVQCTGIMLSGGRAWDYPEGYRDENVSDKIVKYITGEYSYV